MTQKQQLKAGYSLVEVIVAMGVIVVFAMGVFSTIFTTSAIHQNSRETEVASQILQHEIENLRGLRWSQIAQLPVKLSDHKPDQSYIDSYGDNYAIDRTISTNETNMRDVNFTVKWTGKRGDTKQISSSAVYYAKDGLSDSYYRTYD